MTSSVPDPHSGPWPDPALKGAAGQRGRAIARMFSHISARYDLANRILSAGLDLSWRRTLVRWGAPRAGERVLDVGTGTGDLLVEFFRHERALSLTGLDLSREMLALADRKLRSHEVRSAALVEADALDLPFRAERFDVVAIAFGLRNLADPHAGLEELARVLSPGGRLLILEFALPRGPLLRRLYPVYLKGIVPRLGGLVTGSRAAYEYLARSIDAFPTPEEVRRRLGDLDLKGVEAVPLSGGIAVAYRGVRG